MANAYKDTFRKKEAITHAPIIAFLHVVARKN